METEFLWLQSMSAKYTSIRQMNLQMYWFAVSRRAYCCVAYVALAREKLKIRSDCEMGNDVPVSLLSCLATLRSS